MQEIKEPNKKPFIFYYMIVLLVIFLINSLLVPRIAERAVKEVDYTTFMQMTYDGQIGYVPKRAIWDLWRLKTIRSSSPTRPRRRSTRPVWYMTRG